MPERAERRKNKCETEDLKESDYWYKHLLLAMFNMSIHHRNNMTETKRKHNMSSLSIIYLRH